LANENLKVNNEGLTMDNFIIRDENQNTLVASGKIGTESFINPTFDLKVNADHFQVLNATKDDNDFVYGKATFDAVAEITGDLQIPKIDMNLTVGSDTDVTYVMPSATVNIEERDGVVIFVNRENPDAILTRTEEESATIKGFDISAYIKVGKDAAVTIVIDEETGDNFKVSGDGDLNFNMNPNGNMNLAGVYEVQDGHYELNLYNLVNRKFDIVSGSRVTWSGDPFDAKLDIKALYKVETSASSLMAPVFSGEDASVTGKFREVLPFYVYLNIDGQLTEPKIAFNLDMPKDEQGAIGGQVYGRVQQLNQQEDELNRQVFSLLVLNRFYPDPGSDGSAGGVASIARDNLNDAVSDQLNTFSDKLLGNSGFDLNFGLDSYTDYQGTSPQERTQLDIAAQKKLFNDRVIVSVGSEVDVQGSSSTGESTPIIGNVSIEYILTENGRYRLKGFRRNEFENVIDGQTIVSGIALIFTQEFNKFNELWDALVKSSTKKEKQIEADKKAAEEALKAKEEATDESIEEKKN
jgi:predicted  nucleic acid-binding Zn-ribbon protein